MANIPGAYHLYPSGDPIIELTIGTPEGRLITDNWGSKFIIEGNIRLAALAILEYVTHSSYGSLSSSYNVGKITRMTLSRFEFNFENGVQIKVCSGKESEEANLMVEEIQKILEMKAFL